METESQKREAKRPDPDKGEDVTLPPPTLPASPAPAAPAPETTSSSTPAKPASKAGRADKTASSASKPGASAAGGNKGGGGLSRAECDQMMDKYIDVVVTGEGAPLKGMSGKELDEARNMIKGTVAQDPNFKGFKEACYRDLTKAQYACAMKAPTMEQFQNCIR